jgi:hypothetical protein
VCVQLDRNIFETLDDLASLHCDYGSVNVAFVCTFTGQAFETD